MAQYIHESIDSVVQQEYQNWELLIVDDASTDHSIDCVKPFCEKDPRIHLAVNGQHAGIAASRNKAIEMAQGPYLAFLDADDLWHPTKLATQIAFMTQHRIGFCCSSYELIADNGTKLGKIIWQNRDMSYQDYLLNTVIGCSTVVLDTRLVGPVVVPDFRTSEDAATWLAILRKGHTAYAIETPLVSYRIRAKSASSNKLKAAKDLWSVYRKQERLPVLKAVSCFCSYAFHATLRHLKKQ